jgi:hypothetical protein
VNSLHLTGTSHDYDGITSRAYSFVYDKRAWPHILFRGVHATLKQIDVSDFVETHDDDGTSVRLHGAPRCTASPARDIKVAFCDLTADTIEE